MANGHTSSHIRINSPEGSEFLISHDRTAALSWSVSFPHWTRVLFNVHERDQVEELNGRYVLRSASLARVMSTIAEHLLQTEY